MASGLQTSDPSAVVPRRSRSGRLALVLLTIFLAGWIAWSFAANLDAADSRHVLHMDELVNYDGVSQIQDAPDLNALGAAIAGQDHRYGRTTWYLPALVSAPFGEIGGEAGQIVATRAFFALTLLASLFVFAIALLDTWIWRTMAIAAAAVTPFAAYYATMPKPEPLLLLFIAVFLFLMLRRQQNLGWSWFFLGLAFGTKISVAPVLPVMFVLAVLREWGADQIRLRGPIHFAFRLTFTAVSFAAGFVAAVPIVLQPGGWTTYVDNTWSNTGHGGSDSVSISASDWFALMADRGYFGPGALAWLAIALMVVAALIVVVAAVVGKAGQDLPARMKAACRDPRFAGLAVFGAGLLMEASIVIAVKRLWGFYLYSGAALMLIGVFSMLEPMAQRRSGLMLRRGAQVFGAAIFALAFVGGAGATMFEFRQAARRSDDPAFKVQNARYNIMTGMSEALAKQLGRPIAVSFRARFWSPDPSASVRYDPLYGVHNIWEQAYDLVFLEDESNPANIGDPDGPYAAEVRQFLAQRDDHLAASPDAPCKVEPCYVAVESSAPGMYVWQLAKTFPPNASPASPGGAAPTVPAN